MALWGLVGGGHTPWASPMPFLGHPASGRLLLVCRLERQPVLPQVRGGGRFPTLHSAADLGSFSGENVWGLQRRRSPEEQALGGYEWHPLGSCQCVALGAARRHPGGFTETPWLATGRSSTGWVRGPWNDPQEEGKEGAQDCGPGILGTQAFPGKGRWGLFTVRGHAGWASPPAP